jgi:riboflavin kinase / FMN adenylyltransferase
MQTIDGLEALTQPLQRSVVAIGKFDGVHRGHQALIHTAVTEAAKEEAQSLVVTFDRHPVELLQPGTLAHYLTPVEEKLRLIAGLGVDATLLIRLSNEFLSLTAQEFVHSVLVVRLGMVAVVASESFRFGRGAAGTVETLRDLGSQHQYRFQEVPPLLVDGERVSSSRVVQSIREGRIQEAAKLLGRTYALFGRVVRGDGVGRQLGFPTANLETDIHQHCPKDGVYAGFLATDSGSNSHNPQSTIRNPQSEVWLPVVCNLGWRPTRDGAHHRVEAHALNFTGDLYDRSVRLHFTHRLRDEVRFSSLDALRAQIAADVAQAEAMLRDWRLDGNKGLAASD